MTTRICVAIAVLFVCLVGGLPAQTRIFPVDDLRPGMVATGRTVFEGDRLDEFKVHILGVLRNVIGPRRNLILARLEGGPLANTGVIAGITPFDEMVDAATLPGPRRQAARVELTMPLSQDSLRAALSQAFSWAKPFADSPNDVQLLSGASVGPGIGTLLRPIATPITLGGFDTTVADPVMGAFRDRGFLPVMAGGALAQQDSSAATPRPLRPGDPIGVALMSGDLELGATGTVTEVDGDRVYAFGHPFYGLGPTAFPLTRAHVHVVLPSLTSSMKIASTGDVIGTVLQDRATTIAGTLGPGPSMIPVTLNLQAARGTRKTFKMAMVRDQLFTPLLAYLSILNTLTSYERENGVASYAVRGTAQVKNHAPLAF